MLADGVIQHSTSTWNFPTLVVPKKADSSGKVKWRVVVDFRKRNYVTLCDSFPIPVILDVLNSLGNSRYFSSIDCASGFYQIPLRAEDRTKTAFSTDYGHFEYKSMPFGLKGAPATFQRLMSVVLSGMQGLKFLCYLDDLLIFGETLEVHNDRLRDVFGRLRMNNLKLQSDKCEFLRKVILASSINSVKVSSNCMLSAILLKRWIHFFCQSLGECSPSVASSDPSSLFVESSLFI